MLKVPYTLFSRLQLPPALVGSGGVGYFSGSGAVTALSATFCSHTCCEYLGAARVPTRTAHAKVPARDAVVASILNGFGRF